MIIKEVIEHGLNNIQSLTLSLELYYNKYTIYDKIIFNKNIINNIFITFIYNHFTKN